MQLSSEADTPLSTEMVRELELWRAFAARVTLTFPFRVDVLVSVTRRPPPHGDRVQMGVDLHVLDRDTRAPITVMTRRHCGDWTGDDDAVELLFDLLEVALRHETHESVRLDGKLVRELHKATAPVVVQSPDQSPG